MDTQFTQAERLYLMSVTMYHLEHDDLHQRLRAGCPANELTPADRVVLLDEIDKSVQFANAVLVQTDRREEFGSLWDYFQTSREMLKGLREKVA